MRINSGNSIRLIKWKLIGYNILMIYNLYRCSLNVYIYLFIYRKFLFDSPSAMLVLYINLMLIYIYIWGVEIKEEVLKVKKPKDFTRDNKKRGNKSFPSLSRRWGSYLSNYSDYIFICSLVVIFFSKKKRKKELDIKLIPTTTPIFTGSHKMDKRTKRPTVRLVFLLDISKIEILATIFPKPLTK